MSITIPLNITLSSTDLPNPHSLFVQSPEITIKGTTAKLSFNAVQNPLSEYRSNVFERSKKQIIKQNPSANSVMVARWLDIDQQHEALQKERCAQILRIKVNLYTPCAGKLNQKNAEIRPEKRCWTAFVPVISDIVRGLFPQADLKNSSFILHFQDGQKFTCRKNLRINDPNTPILKAKKIED